MDWKPLYLYPAPGIASVPTSEHLRSPQTSARPRLVPSEPVFDAPTPSTLMLDGFSERAASPLRSASTPRAGSASPNSLSADTEMLVPPTPRLRSTTPGPTQPRQALNGQRSPFTRAFAATVQPFQIRQPATSRLPRHEAAEPAPLPGFALSPRLALSAQEILGSPRFERAPRSFVLPGIQGMLGGLPAQGIGASQPTPPPRAPAQRVPVALDVNQADAFLRQSAAVEGNFGLGIVLAPSWPDLFDLLAIPPAEAVHEAHRRLREFFATTPLAPMVQQLGEFAQYQPQQAMLQMHALVNFCRHAALLETPLEQVAQQAALWRTVLPLLDEDRTVVFAALTPGLAQEPVQPLRAWGDMVERLVAMDNGALWGLTQFVLQAELLSEPTWSDGTLHRELAGRAQVLCKLTEQLRGVSPESKTTALTWAALLNLCLMQMDGERTFAGLDKLIECLVAVPAEAIADEVSVLGTLEGLTLIDAAEVLWQLRQLPEVERQRWPEVWNQALWNAELTAHVYDISRTPSQMPFSFEKALMRHAGTRTEIFRYLRYDARVATEARRLNLGAVARTSITMTLMGMVQSSASQARYGARPPDEVRQLSPEFENALSAALTPWGG